MCYKELLFLRARQRFCQTLLGDAFKDTLTSNNCSGTNSAFMCVRLNQTQTIGRSLSKKEKRGKILLYKVKVSFWCSKAVFHRKWQGSLKTKVNKQSQTNVNDFQHSYWTQLNMTWKEINHFYSYLFLTEFLLKHFPNEAHLSDYSQDEWYKEAVLLSSKNTLGTQKTFILIIQYDSF